MSGVVPRQYSQSGRRFKRRKRSIRYSSIYSAWLRPRFERLEERHLLSLSTVPSFTLTGLNAPAHIAFNSSGDLFVSNTAGSTVSEFAGKLDANQYAFRRLEPPRARVRFERRPVCGQRRQRWHG